MSIFLYLNTQPSSEGEKQSFLMATAMYVSSKISYKTHWSYNISPVCPNSCVFQTIWNQYTRDKLLIFFYSCKKTPDSCPFKRLLLINSPFIYFINQLFILHNQRMFFRKLNKYMIDTQLLYLYVRNFGKLYFFFLVQMVNGDSMNIKTVYYVTSVTVLSSV